MRTPPPGSPPRALRLDQTSSLSPCSTVNSLGCEGQPSPCHSQAAHAGRTGTATPFQSPRPGYEGHVSLWGSWGSHWADDSRTPMTGLTGSPPCLTPKSPPDRCCPPPVLDGDTEASLCTAGGSCKSPHVGPTEAGKNLKRRK